MSTRKIPGSKAGRCVRLTTYHLHVPNVKKIRGLNLPDPYGPVQACCGTAFLITRTRQKLTQIYEHLETDAREIGLLVNERKTNYMFMSAAGNIREPQN
jgi:hypothetical protein